VAGSDKSKLLTAVIWLRDIADFDRMNSVWDGGIDRQAMPVRAPSRPAWPARSTGW
jgi:enamine deaminase RidA (YjgF/YER057c/UK114 family)